MSDGFADAKIAVRAKVPDHLSASGDRAGMERLHQHLLDDMNGFARALGWRGVTPTGYGFSARRGRVEIVGVRGERPATLEDLRTLAEKRRAECSTSG